MKYKTTDALRDALDRFVALRDALPALMKPRRVWEQRVPVRAQVEFLQALGAARASMESLMTRTYPSITTAYTINAIEINDGVEAAQSSEQPASVDAVDPSATSTGTPPTRDETSSPSIPKAGG